MWNRFVSSFGRSEVVLWSRIQVLFGLAFGVFLIAWPVISATDITPLLKKPEWVVVWAIFNGVVTEMLRRYRTETRNGVIRSLDDPVDKGIGPERQE